MRIDAIVNWGDDQAAGANGPDNLRFIFTSPLGSSNPISGSQANGLEGMRLTPSESNGMYTGIGGSTGNLYSGSSQNPTNTLEVNSWGATTVAGGSSGLRFTNLNSTSPTLINPGNGVLSVNSAGDIVYVINSSGAGSGFVECTNNTGSANLLNDSKTNLNNRNLYFENHATNAINQNHIGIGYNCSSALPGKLSVYQDHPGLVTSSTIGIQSLNHDETTDMLLTYTGVRGVADGVQVYTKRNTNMGGDFYATGADNNVGIRAKSEMLTNGVLTYGGDFQATGNSSYTIGINSRAESSNTAIAVYGQSGGYSLSQNIGGQFIGGYSPGNCYGVKTEAVGSYVPAQTLYGIYAKFTDFSGSVTTARAGYFVGITEGTAGGIFTSDQMFKTDVNNIKGALSILNILNPRDYYMDTLGYGQMNFSSKKQFGFIAQEVETILPNLIHDSQYPAEYDSLGVMTSPSIPYKSMNYNGIIPLNTAAIQELDREFQNKSLSDQTIKTNVVDLNNSLTKVLAMRGVSYDWTSLGQTNYSLDTCNHVGFIAQELQQVDARLTFVGRDSLLHVEYEKVVPILVEAIEELNDEVESKDSIINAINSRLTTLENCLSGILPFLCQLNQTAVRSNTPETQDAIRAQLSVKLNNSESIILDQNVPNPFAEQTIINFSIPETVQKAQIHFYNSEGRIIQSVDINDRGLGSLTVFGSDLSSGIYTYTLVADGISVATKKMMKQ
jgi:hypothetical protein